MWVKHRFGHHEIDPGTEILVIGTFNPDSTNNRALFFYSRPRNFLWKLIPLAYGNEDLRKAVPEKKIEYSRIMKIDFVDIISEINVDDPDNYSDHYLDGRDIRWTEIISQIDKLANLKNVCLTRSTFSWIPYMRTKVEEFRKHFEEKNIIFECLVTPARFYSTKKQQEWTSFFKN